MFLLNLRKLVGSTVTIGKSSDDGSKSSKGGNIVDNVVPSVQDGMKAGGNIDADGGNIVDDDVGFVQDGMKVGGIIDPDGRNIVDNADGGNIVDDADRGNVIHDDDTSGSIPKLLKTISSENSVEDGLITEKDVGFDAHSILPPKDNTLTPLISFEDCKHVSKTIVSCSYAIRNEVSLSSSEFGDFISSNVDGEIAGCGDEDESKSPLYNRTDVHHINWESVEPFTLDMVFDLENRIEKLERVFSKLKEERFGQKVENV